MQSLSACQMVEAMKPNKKKLPETREEWLADRAAGLGGSDAGAVLSINPYKSAYTLWAEKTGLISGEVKETEAIRIGNDLEDYVARRFTKETGKKVRKSGYSYQSKERPWMLANIDRFVIGENAGLECKTANLFKEGEYRAGTVPPQYYAQCLHYMAVMGFDRMYLAVLVLQRGFFTYEIDRADPAVESDIQALIAAEDCFWNGCVKANLPPEADGSESTSKTLDQLHYKAAVRSGEVADLRGFDRDLEMIEDLKQQIKRLTNDKKEYENQIKKKMISASAVYGNGSDYRVDWKPQEKTLIDSTRLKAERPEIAAEYSKVSKSQPFYVKAIKIGKD